MRFRIVLNFSSLVSRSYFRIYCLYSSFPSVKKLIIKTNPNGYSLYLDSVRVTTLADRPSLVHSALSPNICPRLSTESSFPKKNLRQISQKSSILNSCSRRLDLLLSFFWLRYDSISFNSISMSSEWVPPWRLKSQNSFICFTFSQISRGHLNLTDRFMNRFLELIASDFLVV